MATCVKSKMPQIFEAFFLWLFFCDELHDFKTQSKKLIIKEYCNKILIFQKYLILILFNLLQAKIFFVTD